MQADNTMPQGNLDFPLYPRKNSNIGLLIKNPDTSLETVILDESFIDEIYNQNAALIEYLQAHFKELITYLTEVQDCPHNPSLSLQIPFLVNQVFSLNDPQQNFQQNNDNNLLHNTNPLLNHFFHLTEDVSSESNEAHFPYLDQYFSLLKQEHPNTTFVSFFGDLIQRLLFLNPQYMIDFTYKDSIMDLFLNKTFEASLLQCFFSLLAVQQ
jgi:hypothetical protein